MSLMLCSCNVIKNLLYLTPSVIFCSLLDDEKEVDESEKPYRRLDSQGRKHSPHWYGRRIAKFGQAGKVQHQSLSALHLLTRAILIIHIIITQILIGT